jgi:hypothetical protein
MNSMQLPDYPIGDLATGDVSFGEQGDAEMGDVIDYGDVDHTGTPHHKKTTGHRLAQRMATHVAGHGDARVHHAIAKHKPTLSNKIMQHAAIKHAARNHGVYYEAIKGGRILSSDLGIDAKMAPNEVDALKSAVYLSTPFSPQVFPFNGASPDVLDIVTTLNGVIGTSSIYYAGILLVLAASTLNLNQGATISITRNLTAVNAVTKTVVDTIELDSGVRAVEILFLNAQLVAGHPRFWAPLVAGAALADATSQISIAGLPANYTASARFLQPGDAKVSDFLQML